MSETEIRAVVLVTLKSIAPEIEEATLRADRPLRHQVDLDSIDWLHFLTQLHDKLKVEIPESDYTRLVTLDDVVAYLAQACKSGVLASRRPTDPH